MKRYFVYLSILVLIFGSNFIILLSNASDPILSNQSNELSSYQHNDKTETELKNSLINQSKFQTTKHISQKSIKTVSYSFDHIAKFLAGLSQPEQLAESYPKWTEYAEKFNQRWSYHQLKCLDPMFKWHQEELGNINLPVLYPMSGPDVLNVLTLFPNSPEYILVGLERVGNLFGTSLFKRPDLIHRILVNLENGMNSLFQRSFFITKDMSKDFYEWGVIPTMISLISRLGYEVMDVKLVNYKKDGQITEAQFPHHQGVEITFCKSKNTPQKIYYFRQNLHDKGIESFSTFIGARNHHFAVMFKSASYTPHQIGFSKLVELIEKYGDIIVQDDSGLPYSRLKKSWDVKLYGSYFQPYGESFQAYKQKDLANIYMTDKSIQPLNFRIGYGYGRIPSNMQVARKKEKVLTPQS